MPRTGFVPNGDYIFDLASYGNMYDQKDYIETYAANLMRFVHSVRSAEHYDYKAFVAVSTSSVSLFNQTFYSASKKAMEDFVQVYVKETDKPVVIVRPYSITGVGEQENHLIPKLIDSCLNGTEMPFVDEPVHDFLDVEDFINGMLVVAKNANEHKGEVFPIGSGIQYTNQQVLEIVERVTGRKANIKPIENMRKYDAKSWVANTDKMRQLGWKPKKSLEQSIKEMINART